MAVSVHPHLFRMLKAWDDGVLSVVEYANGVARLTDEARRTNATAASLRAVVDNVLKNGKGVQE